MATDYHVIGFTVTGTADSPQTVTYASLSDEDGNSLPTTFLSAPWIGIGSYEGDRDLNIVPGSKTTTQFQLQLSGLRGDRTVTSVDIDLLIRGTSA